MSNTHKSVVSTRTGKIEGVFEKSLYVFKGVPYAAPPVGNLRWLPPQPLPKWDGVRPAKSFGAIPPQLPIVGNPVPSNNDDGETQSEDCLYLNIWTPGLDDARRPVMVWIHGGAFIGGSGSFPLYRGGNLALRGNIVLVTINYRLGMLGFLNLNEISGGKIPATGNEGLLDQIAALEWVRDNIAGFGGDPHNVTVFGESAGGMSIGCLLAMPRAQGLFQKAILQSGVGSTFRSLTMAVKTAQSLLDLLGLKAGDIDKLMSLDPGKLLIAQQQIALQTIGGLIPVTPVIDGQYLPDPMQAIQAGSAPGIPLIIGTNRDEWKLFEITDPDALPLDDDSLIQRLRRVVPDDSVSLLVDGYRRSRTMRGESAGPSEILSAIRTDAMFRIPAIRFLEARHKNRQMAYGYLFNWHSPARGGSLRACHTLEIGFVFGNLEPKFCGTGPLVDRLSVQMQDAWLAFVRTGNPSCESLGEWPRYAEDRRMMVFDNDSHVESDPYSEERRLWDSVSHLKM